MENFKAKKIFIKNNVGKIKHGIMFGVDKEIDGKRFYKCKFDNTEYSLTLDKISIVEGDDDFE